MHSVGFAGKVRTENSRSNDVARLLLASTLVGVAVAYSRDRTDFYLSFPFFEDIIFMESFTMGDQMHDHLSRPYSLASSAETERICRCNFSKLQRLGLITDGAT